jgi:hypothetical protein
MHTKYSSEILNGRYHYSNKYRSVSMGMSMSMVRDLADPMHLGLKNWPFVPHVQSREPQSIAEAPDGPQAYTLTILRLQEGAQLCLSE